MKPHLTLRRIDFCLQKALVICAELIWPIPEWLRFISDKASAYASKDPLNELLIDAITNIVCIGSGLFLSIYIGSLEFPF